MKLRTRLIALLTVALAISAVAGTTAKNSGAGSFYTGPEYCVVGAAIGYQAGVGPYIRGAGAVSCSATMSSIHATYCFMYDQGPGTGGPTVYSCSSNSDSGSSTLQGTIRHNCGYTTVHYRWWLEVSVVATDKFGIRGGGEDISSGIIPVGPGCLP